MHTTRRLISHFKRQGFTLIELLVVTTIIGILAALLVPVLGRARAAALNIQCVSNLRQWGQATYLYVSANDGLLPPDGSPNGTSTQSGWYVDLPMMLGMKPYQQMPWKTNSSIDPGRSLWICPSNRRRSNGHNLFHYCLNEHVNGTGALNLQTCISSVQQPHRVVWLFDNGKLAAVAQQNNVHTNLHARGAHFLFLDGHTSHFRNRDYWDFSRGHGRTNHFELVWSE
jgi:prepilin-type N-terminal cleavage/methylation domain-containing protein/prepilin-type processing-associated H-X9-DG protein